jgi:hypothetical protein
VGVQRTARFAAASSLLVLVSGCGSGSGSRCGDVPSVNVEVQAVSAIPLGPSAPRIEGAEACVVSPVDCGCSTTNGDGFASLDAPANSEVTFVITKMGRYSNVAHRVIGDVDVSLASRMTDRNSRRRTWWATY